MCELLGLSSKHETTINISLSVLAQRGENPNMHGDGWGIAFHDGDDVRLIKEVGQAKDSQWVEFIKQQRIRSHKIIAHIRKSTIGKVSYSNTHPFTRELFGRVHSFAHNGTLKNITEDSKFQSHPHFNPIGETDSELAFCVLMDRMEKLWKTHEFIPSVTERLEVVKKFADDSRSLGPANFLYSDGDVFFAHGDERLNPETNKLTWPGLHYTQVYANHNAQESGLSLEIHDDVVTLFASVPLDTRKWSPVERGQVFAVSKGMILKTI